MSEAKTTVEPRKRGRPEEMKNGKRRNVYIDNQSWEAAKRLGGGNASEGIRIAIERSKSAGA